MTNPSFVRLFRRSASPQIFMLSSLITLPRMSIEVSAVLSARQRPMARTPRAQRAISELEIREARLRTHEQWFHTEALRGTQWHSVALCGTLWHSVALSGTQWHSVALSGTQRHSEALSGTLNARSADWRLHCIVNCRGTHVDAQPLADCRGALVADEIVRDREA